MLKEKTALITGAYGGIGLETARLFRANGACVVGIDTEHEDGLDQEIHFLQNGSLQHKGLRGRVSQNSEKISQY